MTDHAVIGYVRGRLVDGEFCESLLGIVMEGRTPLDPAASSPGTTDPSGSFYDPPRGY